MRPTLTLDLLLSEATNFAALESQHDEPKLYGVTDGKAVGTYLEHKFKKFLGIKYVFGLGNSASGIDLPELGVDLKVTSYRQPQSSSPFKSARQKIFGLGYHVLVFVYDKTDDHSAATARLDMRHTIFIERTRTGDYQMTRGLREIVERNGNTDDLVAFMLDRNLPVDEIEARSIADEVLQNPPEQGYLTISNALQWRLQYGRAIEQAGQIAGLMRVR